MMQLQAHSAFGTRLISAVFGLAFLAGVSSETFSLAEEGAAPSVAAQPGASAQRPSSGGDGPPSTLPSGQAGSVDPASIKVFPDSLPTEKGAPAIDGADPARRDAQDLVVAPLAPFGRSFFVPARRHIEALEQRIRSGQTVVPPLEAQGALAGFVGPLEMVTSSVYAAIPERYAITVGDQISVSYWAKTLDLQKVSLVIDAEGAVAVPKVGKMVVRGMTLDAFQKNIKAALARVTVNDLELIATLDRLKSIQVFMTGEVFRPGSYAVSAVATLFNALYAGGGPTDLGSLRDIRLIRGTETIRVDFYDYLMQGDSQNDLPLHAGDTIFIPRAGRLVALDGEVNRPAIYELKTGEALSALIDLAGGVKSTGILQRVQVRSVLPNRENILKEIDLTDSRVSDTSLYNDDTVVVLPILPEIVDQVTLDGSVERPGVYAWKPGMRISDLFSEINRPLGETHLERADIVRLNADKKTTTLLSIHIGRALAGSATDNIPLSRQDRVVVYSKFAVAFYPQRVVSIFGAVQQPNRYPRADGMNLSDLLLAAGGVLPGARETVEIARVRPDGEVTLLSINLSQLFAGDQTQNVKIDDEDIVSVRKSSEFFDRPLFATLQGEVKYPGVYALRSREERMSHLIQRAGGLTATAHLPGGVFTRKRDLIPSVVQQGDLVLANRIINMMNDLEYARQKARQQYFLAREREADPASTAAAGSSFRTAGSVAESVALIQLPGAAQSAAQGAGALVGQAVGTAEEGLSMISRPRKFGPLEMQPAERIIVSMTTAIQSPNGAEDLTMKDGDVVVIPQQPTTISVVGAVIRPTVVAHAGGWDIEDYVNLSGGYTHDADAEKVLVSRMNGAIVPADEVDRLEAGDIVFVPPKVIGLEVVTTADKIIELIRFALVTAASVGTFIALIGLL